MRYSTLTVRRSILVVVVAISLAACALPGGGGPPTGSGTPTISPTITPIPTPIPYCPVITDFANGGTLLNNWGWFPGTSGEIQINADNRSVVITAHAYVDLYPGNFNAPKLLTDLRLDSFEFTASIGWLSTINPTGAYEGGGLLIWQDANNYARLETGRAHGVIGIEFDVMDNGVYNRIATLGNFPLSSTLATLDLRVEQGKIVGKYRTTGGPWNETVPYTKLFNKPQIGLDAIEAGDGIIGVVNDGFKASSLAIGCAPH